MASIFVSTYFSSAVVPFTDPELETLLDQAWKKNAHLDITGFLIYSNGHFLQVLEGEESRVTNLLRIIKQDPRHEMFVPLGTQHTHQRAFPDWSMGFKHVSQDVLSASNPMLDHIVCGGKVPDSIPMFEMINVFKQLTHS